MGIAFGSEIVAEVIAAMLADVPDVVAACGERIYGADVVPGETYPACTHAPTGSNYPQQAIGGVIGSEELDYQVDFITDGYSTDPIRAAAVAQLGALAGRTIDHTDGGRHYQIGIEARGESLPTTIRTGNETYRRLGTVYRVTITGG